MDQIKNPFSPGAGSPPPELVGRQPILDQADVLLKRIRLGKSEKSMLLTGLRGVGKTVLVNEIERMAKDENYATVSVEAHEDKSLGHLIVPYLRSVLADLSRVSGASDAIKRALAVLRSFVSGLQLTISNVTIGIDIEPEVGIADSGDLEIDLPQVFVAVGEAAINRKRAVAIFIDEVQYFSEKELGALIMAMHKVQQRQLPLLLLGAGLPILPGLAGESKSYAERLFDFPDIGALSPEDTAKALRDPAQAAGVDFSTHAIEEIFDLTRGYPYFLQEWGYQSWNVADSSPITIEHVRTATSRVVVRLDKNFFRVRFDRLNPSEKGFLRTMAELGPGPHRVAEVAELRKVKATSLGPVRAKLIKKGMVYSPAYGDIAFTVPLFDEFMKRAIPDFPS